MTAAILEGCVSHRSGAGSVTWAWSGNPGGEYDKEREDLALLSHFLKKCLTSVCQALGSAGWVQRRHQHLCPQHSTFYQALLGLLLGL